jgi:hypothetical protein
MSPWSFGGECAELANQREFLADLKVACLELGYRWVHGALL